MAAYIRTVARAFANYSAVLHTYYVLLSGHIAALIGLATHLHESLYIRMYVRIT